MFIFLPTLTLYARELVILNTIAILRFQRFMFCMNNDCMMLRYSTLGCSIACLIRTTHAGDSLVLEEEEGFKMY